MAILIDNFSIGVSEWLPLTDLVSFSVNVVDLDCPISTSGTYFEIDYLPVVTTFSGIPNGYRATCAAPTISGSLTVTLHAENTCSGIVEQSFYLLFGYNLKYDEVEDWGPITDVEIWAKASNSVFCPNTETTAFYFQTKDLESRDLGASIFPSGWADLGAQIVPQSKYLFYGRTYTVTVSGIKDYSGNTMESIVFSFTIENSPI